MINVNQITSMLRRLQPDTALQEYAKANKDSPYIMALALSEAKRREKMKIAAQANAPEQPKVVDQAIQSMGAPMPEDVGIGQLPAGNMNFADGGIVAFGDGGEVERYQDRGLVGGDRVLRTQDGQYFARPLTGQTGYEGMGPSEFLNALYEDIKRKIGPGLSPTDRAKAERAALAEANKRIATQGFSYEELYGPARSTAVTNPEFRSAGAAAAPAAGPGTAAPGAGPGPGANQGRRPPPPDAGAAAPSAAQDPLIAQLLRPVSATPTNFEPSQATMPTAEGIQNLFAASRPNAADVVDPFAEQRQELTNLATLQNAQEQAAFEKQVKERGQLGEKQEARLKAREEKLGKQEKDLGPLAMIQAGFAIMGGQSRSALQNIGLGAQVGFKGYREGLEKLEASRERIEDGLERIETARRSEGILNDQQRSALRREGNNIVREGKKEGINALTAELGVKRGEANALFTAGINVLTEKGKIGSAERLGAAQIQSAADRSAQQIGAENVRAAVQAQTSTQNARTQAAATAASAKDSRMASLAEQVRKNVVAEALKKYPYDVSAQNAYAIDEIKRAVQANPGLAQYMGVSGGGGAPAAGAATDRFNPATGKVEPVR
jgi:hypothetical protein